MCQSSCFCIRDFKLSSLSVQNAVKPIKFMMFSIFGFLFAGCNYPIQTVSNFHNDK